MSNTGAPSQPRQSSRKGKRAWRKNVDVSDIQAGLEEHIQEVIAGGPLSDRASDELFALDTAGSTEISKKYNLQKPLRVDQILAQRSAVPAVDTRKRAADGIYEPPAKKRKEWVAKKDVARLKAKSNQMSHLQDTEDNVFDVWDAPVEPVKNELEYVPKKQAKVAPVTIKRAPIPMTANGKAVRSVKAPKGEASYNPDFDDWNTAIIEAGDAEVKAEMARIAEAEKEEQRLARIEAAQKEEDMGWKTDEESAWEGFETETEVELKKERPGRKTPAERNKVKRKKEAERLAKHEKKMGERQSRALEMVLAQSGGEVVPVQSDDDDESGDDSKLRRRRMGPMVIPEKNLEVVLPDELQDSLRRLKPEGNLLQDRFRNLLVNGKLESRKAITQPKKRKVKLTEKWSFKDFEVGVH